MVLAGSLLGAFPAYGHVSLASSDPADGVTLDAPAAQAVLVFSDPVNGALSRTALLIDGAPVMPPQPVRVDGDTITVPLPAQAGRYRISYRVVGADGHRIDGQIRFTVSDAPLGSVPPTTAVPDQPSSDAGTPTRTGNPVRPALVRGSQSSFWPLAGLGALLLLGALAYVLTIGRNRGKEASSSVGTTGQPHGGDDSSGGHTPGDDHPRGPDSG
jgi:methionine-rich copper-binding protein CopC